MHLRGCFFLRYFLAVVFVDDAGYVGASLVKRRHSPVLLDALRPGVVGSERLDEIEMVALQQFAQIAASAAYVGLGIEGILYSQCAGGRRHKLHQTTRAFGRHGMGVESAFGMNNGVHQIGVKMIGSAGRVNNLFKIGSGMDGNGRGHQRSWRRHSLRRHGQWQ